MAFFHNPVADEFQSVNQLILDSLKSDEGVDPLHPPRALRLDLCRHGQRLLAQPLLPLTAAAAKDRAAHPLLWLPARGRAADPHLFR